MWQRISQLLRRPRRNPQWAMALHRMVSTYFYFIFYRQFGQLIFEFKIFQFHLLPVRGKRPPRRFRGHGRTDDVDERQKVGLGFRIQAWKQWWQNLFAYHVHTLSQVWTFLIVFLSTQFIKKIPALYRFSHMCELFSECGKNLNTARNVTYVLVAKILATEAKVFLMPSPLR